MAGTSHLESWLSTCRRLSKSLLSALYCRITRQHHYSSYERLLPIDSLCVCWYQSLPPNRCHVQQQHKTHKCLVHIFTLAARRWLFRVAQLFGSSLNPALLNQLPRLMFTVYICLHPLSGILWGSEPGSFKSWWSPHCLDWTCQNLLMCSGDGFPRRWLFHIEKPFCKEQTHRFCQGDQAPDLRSYNKRGCQGQLHWLETFENQVT